MPESEDPISDIERKATFRDMGGLAHMLARGTRDEGGTWLDALLVVTAWFYAQLKNSDDNEEEE